MGDICLRFSDCDGGPVRGPLDDRVIGVALEELGRSPRVIGVAGGRRKAEAVRACLSGKLINVLIADKVHGRETAVKDQS